VSRNRELMVLNSIAATVSQSLDVEEVLTKATEKTLELTQAKAGWVILNDVEHKRFRMIGHAGSSGLFISNVSHPTSSLCACQRALRLGHTLVVTDPSECPALKPEVIANKELTHFVLVPLKSKDKALGVMTLACSSESWVSESDLRLLDSIGYHVGLAIENSLLYQETRDEEELRGRLLTAIISAQEEERKRVARELHDGCGQALTGLIMRLESAASLVPSTQAALSRELAHARGVAAQTLEEMRKLTQGLRSTVLDDLGLVAAIRSYSQTHLEEAGVHVTFETDGVSGRLPAAIETAVFRIVQEAINNIVRHAHAANVLIRLRSDNGRISVFVEDDGQGFDVAAPTDGKVGTEPLGLLHMRERATLLGGAFSLTSAVGQGTRILVEIPVESLERGLNGGQDTRTDSR
ncbi:MAG: GAF domain-containing sensor histidine kinase, partial [Chloroflexota bacterium]|nr:GAF domain-containing sensor histidine kinase [Chloroflexota bacterium]